MCTHFLESRPVPVVWSSKGQCKISKANFKYLHYSIQPGEQRTPSLFRGLFRLMPLLKKIQFIEI